MTLREWKTLEKTREHWDTTSTVDRVEGWATNESDYSILKTWGGRLGCRRELQTYHDERTESRSAPVMIAVDTGDFSRRFLPV